MSQYVLEFVVYLSSPYIFLISLEARPPTKSLSFCQILQSYETSELEIQCSPLFFGKNLHFYTVIELKAHSWWNCNELEGSRWSETFWEDLHSRVSTAMAVEVRVLFHMSILSLPPFVFTEWKDHSAVRNLKWHVMSSYNYCPHLRFLGFELFLPLFQSLSFHCIQENTTFNWRKSSMKTDYRLHSTREVFNSSHCWYSKLRIDGKIMDF
jgi:hypothetical protein